VSEKWDNRFLDLARFVSGWSKDPSTKVGAVIADANRRIVSVGYNGFPIGVDDTPWRLEDREMKLSLTVHAEINAVLFAKSNGEVSGCTLYTWPFMPCDRCAVVIIQSQMIDHVTAPVAQSHHFKRWGDAFTIAYDVMREAGLSVTLLEGGQHA